MNTDTRNYYERELDKIDFTGEHSASVLFGSEGKTTKALAVNAESAAAIIAKLVQVFMLPAARPAVAPVAKITRPYVSYKTGMDVNGYKVLKITSEGRGFSLQTNGVLPTTHSDGVGPWTDDEVVKYVRQYGTFRQKRILGI